jgi:hypothetical protein
MTRATLAVGLFAFLLPWVSAAEEYRSSVEVDRGGTLEVDLAVGSIEIDTHDDPQVEVDARSSGSFRFELSSDGSNARFTGETSGWLGMLSSGDVSVRIKIPEAFSLELDTSGGEIEIDDVQGDVSARTSGGRIELDGAVGQVDLRTSGGRIQVDDVEGDVRANTSGGSVEVAEVTGEVEVRTSGGHIKVHDVGGPVFARTSGGRISVRFVDAAEGDLETSGGSIEVEMGSDAGIDLDASTSGGRVSIDDDVPVSGTFGRSSVQGKVNGGGPELRLRTSGGNVRLRVR